MNFLVRLKYISAELSFILLFSGEERDVNLTAIRLAHFDNVRATSVLSVVLLKVTIGSTKV